MRSTALSVSSSFTRASCTLAFARICVCVALDIHFWLCCCWGVAKPCLEYILKINVYSSECFVCWCCCCCCSFCLHTYGWQFIHKHIMWRIKKANINKSNKIRRIMCQSSDIEANKEIKRAKTTDEKDKFQEKFHFSQLLRLVRSRLFLRHSYFFFCHLYSNMVLFQFLPYIYIYLSVALVANRRRKRKVFTFRVFDFFLVIVNVLSCFRHFYPWRRKYTLSE